VALVTAGYKPREARAAVENARPHVGESATLEQVIREALRQCGLARVPTSQAPDDFDKAGVLPQVGKSRSTLRCSIG
jgi:16S rRNA U1498 N3-methylase RsmE